MNKNERFKGAYKDKNRVAKTDLSVFVFKEKELFYCFCAPLELYGYGNSENEAKKSFTTGLSEFIRYTQNKGTFTKELKRLGWFTFFYCFYNQNRSVQ